MRKKKDYKVIQIGFRTKKQYDDYHTDAVKYFGMESRLADCAYARECIKNNKKLSKAAMKEKAKTLAEQQTTLTEMIRQTNDEEIKNIMMKISKETINLWVG